MSRKFRLFTNVPRYFATVGDPRRRVQAGGSGWVADYASPFIFVNGLLTCAGPVSVNLGRFCDGAVDRDVVRAHALQGTDPAAANHLWARVERKVSDDAPWLFLTNPRTSTLVSARVGNYQYSLQWGPLLDQLWVR